MKLNPYLAFDGRCREAFEFYEKALAAGFCVAVHFDDVAEGERVFNTLARDGKVQMPFQPTFWAKGFGMLIDGFDTPWIVNAGQVAGS